MNATRRADEQGMARQPTRNNGFARDLSWYSSNPLVNGRDVQLGSESFEASSRGGSFAPGSVRPPRPITK